MSGLSNLNKQYLTYLVKYPLLTKAVTAGVFSGLSEIVSSGITNEFKETVVFGKYKVKHFFTRKLLTMIIYGSLIATPISHNLYEIINNKLFVGTLTTKGKILKILTSLSTVTPLLSACFTAWIALINNYEIGKEFSPCTEIKKIIAIAKAGLKKGYTTVLKSSLVTSFFSLIVAQKFIPPQLWVVFFNLVYFVLGTYQNTKLKLAQKKLRLQQEKEQEKKEE